MTPFHNLFRERPRPVGSGFPLDRRGELFPATVARSRFHFWTPGDPICQRGQRLLIGVATWSGYDLNLLDLIEESAPNDICVDVFNIDAVPDPGDKACFELYIPGLASALQTPFVGLWRDGVLAESASGYLGRQLVASVCQLDPAELHHRMQTVLTRK